jgi:hypothetical protein
MFERLKTVRALDRAAIGTGTADEKKYISMILNSAREVK